MLGPFRVFRAVKFLVTAPLILLTLLVVNLMTPGGHWFRWAAFGIAVAWLISLVRVIRAALLVGGLAALAAYLRRK